MPQDRFRHGLDVLDGDVGAALQDRAGLGGEDEVLAGAGAGPEADVLLDEVGHRHAGFARSRQAGQLAGVADDVTGRLDLQHEVLHRQDFLGRDDRLDLHLAAAGGRLDDAELVGLGRVVDLDVEHEPVLLRLGQRVRSFLLDGVLRGQHEERVGQPVPLAGDRDLPLLHRFEQRRLRLRRGAVDLVGQDDVREDRPLDEAELARPGRPVVVQEFGPGDVRRHQVGRKLHAVEAQGHAVGQRVDHQRLGQAGHADEQTVALRQHGEEELFEDFFLADDDLGALGEEPVAGPAQGVGAGDVVLFEEDRLDGFDGTGHAADSGGLGVTVSLGGTPGPPPRRRRNSAPRSRPRPAR